MVKNRKLIVGMVIALLVGSAMADTFYQNAYIWWEAHANSGGIPGNPLDKTYWDTAPGSGINMVDVGADFAGNDFVMPNTQINNEQTNDFSGTLIFEPGTQVVPLILWSEYWNLFGLVNTNGYSKIYQAGATTFEVGTMNLTSNLVFRGKGASENGTLDLSITTLTGSGGLTFSDTTSSDNGKSWLLSVGSAAGYTGDLSLINGALTFNSELTSSNSTFIVDAGGDGVVISNAAVFNAMTYAGSTVEPGKYTADALNFATSSSIFSGDSTISVLTGTPVSLDPVVTINPDADAFVRSGTYANNNYGTTEDLQNKSSGGNYGRRSFLRFSLASVSGNITNATLRLKVRKTQGDTHNVNFISDDSWGETAITWATAPVAGALLGSIPLPASETNVWVELNVTSQVVAEYSGDKKISLLTMPSANALGDYYSKEAASSNDWPQLVVEVEPGVAPISAPNGLSASVDESGNIALDWVDSIQLEFASYSIYRSTNSGNYGAALASDLVGSEYIDNSVVLGQTYYYVVTATDIDENESGFSDEISVISAFSSSIGAIEDTHIHGSNKDTNYGTNTTLEIKYQGTDSNNRHSYLKFDLSEVSGTIVGATLRVKSSGNNGLGDTLTVRAMTDSWVETNVTWNSIGANRVAYQYLGAALDSALQPSVGDWLELDVSDNVVAESEGDQVVSLALVSDGNNVNLFHSREAASAADRPQLVLAIIPPPGIPYGTWLESYSGMGSLTNLMDDVEPDGMNNLLEYALGGDPTSDDAATVMPNAGMNGDWMYYVYNKRSDAAEVGLTYTVVTDTDLVYGSFTNEVPEYGASEVAVQGYVSTTNRISTTTDAQAFMELEIGFE